MAGGGRSQAVELGEAGEGREVLGDGARSERLDWGRTTRGGNGRLVVTHRRFTHTKAGPRSLPAVAGSYSQVMVQLIPRRPGSGLASLCSVSNFTIALFFHFHGYPRLLRETLAQ